MLYKTDIHRTGQIIQINSGHFDVDLKKLLQLLKKHWLYVLIVTLLLYVAFTKDIHFALHLNSDENLPSTKALTQRANLKQKVWGNPVTKELYSAIEVINNQNEYKIYFYNCFLAIDSGIYIFHLIIKDDLNIIKNSHAKNHNSCHI